MRLTRRELLKAALVSAPLLVSSRALGLDGQTPPSEKVRIGIIGTGNRARYEIHPSLRQAGNACLVCCCDIFQPKMDGFMKNKGTENVHTYNDFRKMIETEKPDGVMIETATHQRAWIGVTAMSMGMNIYLEKPMCLTIQEGRVLVNAARKYNRVTQVGTQQRSLPLCRWACRQIADGAIGKVKTVIVPNFVGPVMYPGTETLDPKDCPDWWNTWTNQAVLRPCKGEIQFGWAQWGDYDGGGRSFGVSGWGTHSFDQMQAAIGTSLTGPVEITLMEPCTEQDSGRYDNRRVEDDETGAQYYQMARIRGPRGKIRMKFENGVEARFELDADRGPGLGCIVVGEKGKIEINRHKISSNPKEIAASLPQECKNTRDENVYHIENWADCIKTGKKANADIEIGQRSTTICELVNIVRAAAPVGKAVHWNPQSEQFDDLPEGNTKLSRPRREGWELPTV